MQTDPGQEPAVPAPATPVEGLSRSGPREIEIKFAARGLNLKDLLSSPALQGTVLSRPHDLVSVYFDTPTNGLRRNGIVLRVRKKDRATPVIGVKWSVPAHGGVFGRGEVEVPCVSGEPDIGLFDQELRDRLADVAGGGPLERRFETRVKRRTANIRHGLSAIEIAFDEGTISAGDKKQPLGELELELKTGTESDLIDFAMKLADSLPLRLDFTSKSEKGYLAAAEKRPKPRKAIPIEIAPAESLDGAVSAVLGGTLAHFVSNWAPLRESDDPESIHQLRVALRRMRSALAAFKRMFPSAEIDELRAEAKRIATGFGPARDCDAFLENAAAGPLKDEALHPKGADSLLEKVERRRNESYIGARQLLEDAETTRFVLKVQSFLARRAWRNALPGDELPKLTMPAADFAEAALQRLHKRALKRGKHLPDVPDDERHQLRIALKNFRYGAEFFGKVFDRGKPLDSMLGRVSELQDILGAHNDAVTARLFIERLEIPAADPATFASGFLLGWYQHVSIMADTHLMKTWKAFRRCKPFWN